MDRPHPILTESALRPAWSRLHQIASQANQLTDWSPAKDDKSFLINVAKDAQFKFYWQLDKHIKLSDAQELLGTSLKLWLLLETKVGLMTEQPRKVLWDTPISAAHAIGVFRDEATRQIELGIAIVQKVLDEPGLFSEDPDYPGVTRDWLDELIRTLAAERNKLELNEATIAVIGTMKAGKSTVINAVVGSEVVPSRDQPMTTFPTRVVHVPGKLVPELYFPLSPGFNTLAAAIKAKDDSVTTEGGDLARMLDGQPAAGDLLILLEAIRLGTLHLPNRAEGHVEIQDVLGRTNDLTRLAVALGVDPAVATPERLSFSDIPSIEVEFEHLATVTDQSGGRFAMVDTPGPNEAGKNERLRQIVRTQLAEASGVILVLNYSELGASAAKDLMETLKEIPEGQAEHLTILANRYDQKGAQSLSPQEVKNFACERMTQVLGFTPAGLADRIYPTSARFALRAHQAKRAVRLSQPIDPGRDGWAEEFATAGMGVLWRGMPHLLADPKAVATAIPIVWEQSGFAQPLERTLITSARNATLVLILSALGKLRERSGPLLEMLNVRDSAFLRSLEELEKGTHDLKSDLHNLDLCLDKAIQTLESMEAEISPAIQNEINTLIEDLRSTSDGYLKTGLINFTHARSSLLDLVLPGYKQRRIKAAIKEYKNKSHDIDWIIRVIGDYGNIDCKTSDEATRLSNSITEEIDSLFKHFVKSGGDIVDDSTTAFIERAHQDVGALFAKEWQNIQDRIADILGLEIDPPRPIGSIDPGIGEIKQGSFIKHRHWSATEWEDIEGKWYKRAAASFMNFFDSGGRNWGRRETPVEREEHTVDIGQIRKTSLAMAQTLADNMNKYFQESIKQLREETAAYAEDVQTRAKSINAYLLEEMRHKSDESAENEYRRKIITMLAMQARDLISEAIAIRSAVKEMQNG